MIVGYRIEEPVHRLAEKAPDSRHWQRRLTWLVWRQRILGNLPAIAVAVLIFGGAGAFYLDSRQAVAFHQGTLVDQYYVARSDAPPLRAMSVRLDSGNIVPVQGVPIFRKDAGIVVQETVSGILRIHRFTFVSYSDQPAP